MIPCTRETGPEREGRGVDEGKEEEEERPGEHDGGRGNKPSV